MGWPVKISICEAIVDRAEEDVKDHECRDGQTLDTGWDGAPANWLRASVVEGGGYGDIAFQQGVDEAMRASNMPRMTFMWIGWNPVPFLTPKSTDERDESGRHADGDYCCPEVVHHVAEDSVAVDRGGERQDLPIYSMYVVLVVRSILI